MENDDEIYSVEELSEAVGDHICKTSLGQGHTNILNFCIFQMVQVAILLEKQSIASVKSSLNFFTKGSFFRFLGESLIKVFSKILENRREDAARKLDSTVDMSVQIDPYKNINSIWKVSAKDLPTLVVDKKKLMKAEGRNKDKAEKRIEQSAAAPRRVKPQIIATASQTIGKRTDTEGGNSLDIQLENVDISFGNK